jgi:hypothetical protein
MTVAKVLARGVLLAGCLGSPARGGAMLVLGTFSDPSTSASTAPSVAQTFAPSWDPAPPNIPAQATVVPPPWVPTSFTPPPPAPPVDLSPPPPPIAPRAPAFYDAFINFGDGPYPDSGGLTTGNAMPWFTSRQVAGLFGGIPNAQQQGDFDNAVVQRIGQTFRQSGIPLSLTLDPNAAVAHTISVVSNTGNPTATQAIGMTYLGGNGFHFIDKAARSARTLDQLEWVVAHNVAHELMLAFNVPEVHDASGSFIDSRTAGWKMMIDPNARFSPEAAGDLLSRDFRSKGTATYLMGAQILEPSPVPEPATLALWTLGAAVFGIAGRVRSRRDRPA